MSDANCDLSTIHPELLRKWRQIYYFCTASNDDSVMTPQSWERVRQKLLTNEKMPAVKRQQTAEIFQEIWDNLLGEKQSFTIDEFLPHHARLFLYHAGTKALVMTKFYSRLFHCVDFNDDGFIEMAEFLVFSQACGFRDEATIKQAFTAIDVNRDGTISKEEYIDAYLKYDLDAAVRMEDLPIYGLP